LEDNQERIGYKEVADRKVYKHIFVKLEPETPEQKQKLLSLMREYTWVLNYIFKYLNKEGLFNEVTSKGLSESLYKKLFHMLKNTYGLPDWLIEGVLAEADTILSQWYSSGTFGKGHYPQAKTPRLYVLSTWFFPDLDNLDKPWKIKRSRQGYLWLPIGVKLREIGMNISYLKDKEWSDAKLSKWARLIYREEYDAFYLEIIVEKETPPPKEDLKEFIAVDVNRLELSAGNGDKYLERRYPTVLGDPKVSAKIDSQVKKLERLREKHQRTGRYDPLERRKGLRHRVWLINRAINEIAKHHIVKIAKAIFENQVLPLNANLVLEDLKGLQKKLIEESDVPKEVKKKVRIMDYYQLHRRLIFLAKLHRIPVIYVNPSGTSTTCPKCGSKMVQVEDPVIGKRTMVCTNPSCGFKEDRDTIALMNLVKRAIEKKQALQLRKRKVSIGQKSTKNTKQTKGKRSKNAKWSKSKKTFKP
jgi:putative transposase